MDSIPISIPIGDSIGDSSFDSVDVLCDQKFPVISIPRIPIDSIFDSDCEIPLIGISPNWVLSVCLFVISEIVNLHL